MNDPRVLRTLLFGVVAFILVGAGSSQWLFAAVLIAAIVLFDLWNAARKRS